MHHRQIARERARGGRQERREGGGERGKEREEEEGTESLYVHKPFLTKVLQHLVASFTDTGAGGLLSA